MKILIIKLRAIGDVLLSTPVIENLKIKFPDSKIDFLVEKFAAPIVELNPFLNNVIIFDRKKDSSIDLIKKIKSEKYDMVFDLFGNPRSAIITFFSGADKKIGFKFRGRSFAYNYKIFPRGNKIHNIDFNLDALLNLNIEIKTKMPKFVLSENISNEVKNFAELKINNNLNIGINPSGGWEIKQWKTTQFAELSKKLIKNYSAKIFLFFGPNEIEKVTQIKNLVNENIEIIPNTNLHELGFLIKKMNYFISNDSGPMHIAASFGIPTLGIFGPTNPFLQGPIGEKSVWIRKENLDCIACNKIKCEIGNICMTELEVENVYLKIKEMIENEKKF